MDDYDGSLFINLPWMIRLTDIGSPSVNQGLWLYDEVKQEAVS